MQWRARFALSTQASSSISFNSACPSAMCGLCMHWCVLGSTHLHGDYCSSTLFFCPMLPSSSFEQPVAQSQLCPSLHSCLYAISQALSFPPGPLAFPVHGPLSSAPTSQPLPLWSHRSCQQFLPRDWSPGRWEGKERKGKSSVFSLNQRIQYLKLLECPVDFP